MQINLSLNTSNQTQFNYQKTINTTKENTKDANTPKPLNTLNGKNLTHFYLIYFYEQTANTTTNINNTQVALNNFAKGIDLNHAQTILTNIDFASLAYNGKTPLNMDTQELEQLISEEGFFGVQNTANRIADFIIKNSGDDIEKLKQGLKGMKKGFEQAKQMWGGELPKISQDTMKLALEKINDRMDELERKPLNLQA